MTALRQQFIDALDLRGLAPLTRRSYVHAVAKMARHGRKSPALFSDAEIHEYLLYLIRDRQHSRSTMNAIVSALRFFYQHVLGRSLQEVEAALPRMKREIRRPQVYSITEIERLLQAPMLKDKHRVLLMTVYSSGLRVSELVRL